MEAADTIHLVQASLGSCDTAVVHRVARRSNGILFLCIHKVVLLAMVYLIDIATFSSTSS